MSIFRQAIGTSSGFVLRQRDNGDYVLESLDDGASRWVFTGDTLTLDLGPCASDTPADCTCADKAACDACEHGEQPTVAVLIEISPSSPHGYIAQCEQFSQFGVGETPFEALTDYFTVMAEHMEFLARHEYTLASGLANELGYLRTLAGNGRI